MKRLKRPPPGPNAVRHPDDVALLSTALELSGYTADDRAIAEAYEEFSSQEYAAGWLSLPKKDQEIVRAALHLVEQGYLIEEDSP